MDLIEEEFGVEVANAMRGDVDALRCECCDGTERLRGVPLIMASHEDGGRAVDGSEGPPQRAICSWCFAIWYDCGICDPAEIGREHKKRRANGQFPFTQETTKEALFK